MSLRGVIGALAQGGPFLVTRRVRQARVKGRTIEGPSALVVADDLVESVDADTDTLTLTAHGLRTGDGPVQLVTDDTLPAGLEPDTDYWAVRIDDDTLQLTESLDDAMAATPTVVDLIDSGTGVHTLIDTTTTERQNRETFTIVASLQPIEGRELRDLPEGQRGDEIRVLYTLTALRTRTPGYEPDVITLDGESWVVIRVQRYDAFGETHYRAYVARHEAP